MPTQITHQTFWSSYRQWSTHAISINEAEFNKAKPLYKKALKSSDFNKNLKLKSIQEKPSRNRKRKVVWFNPPDNAEVKTNIGRVFLKLV